MGLIPARDRLANAKFQGVLVLKRVYYTFRNPGAAAVFASRHIRNTVIMAGFRRILRDEIAMEIADELCIMNYCIMFRFLSHII